MPNSNKTTYMKTLYVLVIYTSDEFENEKVIWCKSVEEQKETYYSLKNNPHTKTIDCLTVKGLRLNYDREELPDAQTNQA